MNLFVASTLFSIEDTLIGAIDKRKRMARAKKGRSKKKGGRKKSNGARASR